MNSEVHSWSPQTRPVFQPNTQGTSSSSGSASVEESYFEALLRERTRQLSSADQQPPCLNTMAATMPAQRGSISSDFISLDFGFRGDTLLTLAAPMGITLGTQRPQNVSRFQQLLNRKLEAEKTSATPSPPAPTIPDAVDLALANFKGTNTVVERAFAGRHFVSDSEHEPQLQSIKAEPVSPRVAGTRNPLRPNPPASASATDNDLVPVPQAVGNTDQLSNQFRHMVAQRIASMFASSEANMSGADVGAPSQGNVAPSYWPQQPYADMSPYQQMVQAKFAPQPEVKVEPEQDMFRSVPWDSQPQPQPQHLLTPPAHSWQQYQSPRYPVMFGQQGGELMPDAPVPASAKSSTSSLPVPSPTTPRQSYNYAYAGPLPSSYGTMPKHNHRSSDASSIGVMDGENAPVYGPPHAVHYGSTMYGPSHGVIRLPDGAHYTTASTGDQANGAGPSGWDDTAPNGIGGGNGDIGDNAGYSGEAGGIPPPPGGGDDGNAGGAGGDGGPPDSGGGGGGGGDGGDGGDDGGDDQHPVHKKKLGKSTTDLVSVPSLIRLQPLRATSAADVSSSVTACARRATTAPSGARSARGMTLSADEDRASGPRSFATRLAAKPKPPG